ncbi:hypothetical protein [Alistipes ihumii]|uniref:hypothetical protein n=1 Tax=Alistipes ihumii TaxID=1470347 RepID=UPI003AAD1A27
MEKQILLPPAVLRELRETFHVHQVVLNRALRYAGNSSRDNMLRQAALQRGGMIYRGITAPKGYIPDVDTTFENGYMHQWFGRRIEVVVHMESNKTVINIDGRQVVSFDGLTLSSWGNMLYALQMIYNRLCNSHPAYTSEAKPIESKIRKQATV